MLIIILIVVVGLIVLGSVTKSLGSINKNLQEMKDRGETQKASNWALFTVVFVIVVVVWALIKFGK